MSQVPEAEEAEKLRQEPEERDRDRGLKEGGAGCPGSSEGTEAGATARAGLLPGLGALLPGTEAQKTATFNIRKKG